MKEVNNMKLGFCPECGRMDDLHATYCQAGKVDKDSWLQQIDRKEKEVPRYWEWWEERYRRTCFPPGGILPGLHIRL